MSVIPFKKPEDKCSFCGRPASVVSKMHSNGKDKFICGRCVAQCKERLKDES